MSANIMVLTDELGLQREYREVKRKAAVGDYLVFDGYGGGITANKPYLVVDFDHDGGEFVDDDGDTRWQAHIIANCTVIEPTDVVIVNGARYRLVERKANVGERIVVVDQWYSGDSYRNGDMLTVDGQLNYDACVSTVKTDDNPYGYLSQREYRVLEPLDTAKVSEQQPIVPEADIIGLLANLSTRLAEAERKIVALEHTKVDRMFTRKAPGIERVAVSLTREDIIERAKEDVAELLSRVNGLFRNVDFVINREKRVVVALDKSFGVVTRRGKSRCAPDDVFNTHIGRAIALRRALGFNVPEAYTDAPKPTKAKVGDIIVYNNQAEPTVVVERTFNVSEIVDKLRETFGRGLTATALRTTTTFGHRIIDDSREETEVTA